MTTETNNNETTLHRGIFIEGEETHTDEDENLIVKETFRVYKDSPCECCGNIDFTLFFPRVFLTLDEDETRDFLQVVTSDNNQRIMKDELKNLDGKRMKKSFDEMMNNN